MIKEFFDDVVKTARYFEQVRKARKTSAVVSEPGKSKDIFLIPVYEIKPAFYNTVEGCQLANCGRRADKAGLAAFKAMPYELQRVMEFSPKSGEFIERAMQWQTVLREVAPDKDGYAAMVGILSWYRHIKHMRL